MKYYTYVLQNTIGTLYKGVTSDLAKRISEHNTVSGKWTSSKGPWKLVYSEEYLTKTEALQREKFLKSGQGRLFLKQIVGRSASA